METKREQITTEVVFNGDRTYEVKRRIEGCKGDKAILIGLYPISTSTMHHLWYIAASQQLSFQHIHHQ